MSEEIEIRKQERQRILKIIEEMDNRGPDDIIFKKRLKEKIEGEKEKNFGKGRLRVRNSP